MELQVNQGDSNLQQQEEDQELQAEVDRSESTAIDTQPSSIALGRPRRVGPPKRYGFKDMVGYAL